MPILSPYRFPANDFSQTYSLRFSPISIFPFIRHPAVFPVDFVHNELTVSEMIRLMIHKLIRAINIPTTIKVIFFFASFTSAHLADSMIRIIQLNITIVTASTIVILKRNLAILTISGASVCIAVVL